MTLPARSVAAALFASALAVGASARAADAGAPAVDRSYAVIVSDATYANPDWRPVVDALLAKHSGTLIHYAGGVDASLEQLKRVDPRYACFVATPTEAGRRYVVDVSRLTRRLNDDPYGDVVWGIITGHTAADAMRIASVKDPLVIRKAGAGTPIDLNTVESGTWFSEATAGEFWTKDAGGTAVRHTGPADSIAEIVAYLNDEHPDLFVTSGHASEHVWAAGYKYKNGYLKSSAGRMAGVDLAKQSHPVDSPNPKVFLAIGNCLMGHIEGDDSMALGWMGSGGVDQFVGYTVVTWYGAMGWGVNSYLFDHPGQHDLAEAFYFSNQCVVHDLATRFPKSASVDIELPESDNGKADKTMDDFAAALTAKVGPLDGKKGQDNLGLMWDRDVVAFYGDPLWDARLAPHGPTIATNVTQDGDTYHFTAVASDDARVAKPIAMLLPHRVRNVHDVTSTAGKPLVTDNFVMVFDAKKLEKGKPIDVTFKADPAPAVVAVK